MNGDVTGLVRTVPDCCRANYCDRDGCKVSLVDAPPKRVVIDMDCPNHQIHNNQKRCDYLFIGEENNTRWVAPVEMKSGRVKSVTDVRKQLEGGVKAMDSWLKESISFEFVPVLVHGKKIHRNDNKRLRSEIIQFRGQRRKISLLRCDNKLVKALHQ